ncbi:minor histocompatibility antigen H13-like [Limulus polyphemus]|uniref:Minor histocompatibility antigen H13-like n=1 Tax=Limulus polyphemus TaxID=6850 RepID=A0ABM1AZL5_LIMPO|nr:minor histocompatibility antigen H13-like [Limulus polyphemus]
MADVNVNQTISELNATLNETSQNATEKWKATPEGMAFAYTSLILMAILPIFFGSFRSVKHHKEQKESGEKPDTMSHRDAAMFPLIASGALLGIYIFFKIFSKEYINLLLTGYFFFLGVLALAHILSPVVNKMIPESFPNEFYHLIFSKGQGEQKEEVINYEFDHKDLVCLFICTIMGVWYLWKKHWVANNLFGLAFAINGVELLHLNSVITGCILLGGLFIYDVFWVFGTDVMVTVAKSFEAPIKLVFPQDFLERGVYGTNFAMLGLGDIVIPGIFIALLLRFDHSLKRERNVYFYSSFLAYFVGLVTTVLVMTYFKHAQPALLYLVPACIGVPFFVALLRGDIKTMFQYEDHPEESKTDAVNDESKDEVKKEK